MLADWYRTMRYRQSRPMLYTALVPRRIVDDVIRRHGRFLHGMAPDVASGVEILAETETYVETDVAAVVSHYPSWDPRWSNGASASAGAVLGGNFVREFGQSPLGKLPVLSTSIVYQTLLECSRLRPEIAPSESRMLRQYAREASAEVELWKRGDRIALHMAIFSASQASGGNSAAVLAQLRSIVYARISPALRQRVRGMVHRREPAPGRSVVRACANLKEALESIVPENRLDKN
jgi:hypothetical protein